MKKRLIPSLLNFVTVIVNPHYNTINVKKIFKHILSNWTSLIYDVKLTWKMSACVNVPISRWMKPMIVARCQVYHTMIQFISRIAQQLSPIWVLGTVARRCTIQQTVNWPKKTNQRICNTLDLLQCSIVNNSTVEDSPIGRTRLRQANKIFKSRAKQRGFHHDEDMTGKIHWFNF